MKVMARDFKAAIMDGFAPASTYGRAIGKGEMNAAIKTLGEKPSARMRKIAVNFVYDSGFEMKPAAELSLVKLAAERK